MMDLVVVFYLQGTHHTLVHQLHQCSYIVHWNYRLFLLILLHNSHKADNHSVWHHHSSHLHTAHILVQLNC